MRYHHMIAFCALVGCGTEPTQEDSKRLVSAATAATNAARLRALAGVGQSLVAPAELALDFNGDCPLGGTVAVTGTCDAEPVGSSVDVKVTFTGCQDAHGTLDGDVHWTSSTAGPTVSATLKGSLDLSSSNGAVSCDLDLALSMSPLRISYTGSACGYDARVELGL